MKKGKSKCRRVWNVDVTYIRNAIKGYKAKTGVTAEQICNVLNIHGSVLSPGKIKEYGINASVLFKVCAIVGIDPYDEKLYIGGKPVYTKPVEEERTEIKVAQDPADKMKEDFVALHNENEVLRRKLAKLEAEINGIREVLI